MTDHIGWIPVLVIAAATFAWLVIHELRLASRDKRLHDAMTRHPAGRAREFDSWAERRDDES